MSRQPTKPDSDPTPAPPILNYFGPANESKLIPLRQFNSEAEAICARSRLESEGIRTQVTGGALRTLMSGYGQVVKGVELFVLAADFNRAQEILTQIDARKAARRAAHEAKFKCPRCGSITNQKVGRFCMKLGAFLFAIGYLAFFVPLLFHSPPSRWTEILSWIPILMLVGLMLIIIPTGRRTCLTCGKNFKTSAEVSDDDDDDYSQTSA